MPPHYHFPISAPHLPSGDQPQAIQALVEQLQHHDPTRRRHRSHSRRGQKYSILRGCTGTGKTLVMAHTVSRLGRGKTLVLCHNKTLAAQLARELRTFFHPDHMAVELFVSYYKHYIPESFSATTSRYIAKKSSTSDELDASHTI
jgi:excinuclease ABC subunit B